MPLGIFATQDLRAHGMRPRDVRAAVSSGTLLRARRGWYATPSVSADLFTATRVGGRLTCLAGLRHHGCWTPESTDVHVRVADGVAVRRPSGVLLHWTDERVGPGVDPVEDALRAASACLDLRALVTVADSIAQRRLLTPSGVAEILGTTPRGRRALALHDPRAESGIETIVRLALRRHRIRVRSQVVIRGVGRVDLLVGERLVIEADGYEWHADREAFERDRERDRELVRRGYVVIRVTYRQAIDDVDAVILAVLDVIRRRDHRWRAVHRSQLSLQGYLVDVSSTNLGWSES